jgi:calcineurin-like phosphoesterase family protein
MDLSGLGVVGRSVSDYYTADLHLGHVRIPELADRPYPDADAMNEDLTRRWNRTVAPRDTVYVLGDVALGRIADSLPLVARLHGKKILVPGNHDRCHPMNPRAGEWRDRYRDAGFDKILPVNAPGSVGPFPVTLSHFPPAGDSQDVDRYELWRPCGERWTVHGHVHGRWRQHGRCINVGVDAWGGYPVPADSLAALIADGPADLPLLPWEPPYLGLDGTHGHAIDCTMVAGELGEMANYGCTCGRRPAQAAAPVVADRVYRREHVTYSKPGTTHGARAYHWEHPTRDGVSACGRATLCQEVSADPATVEHIMRCGRPGCRQRWARQAGIEGGA